MRFLLYFGSLATCGVVGYLAIRWPPEMTAVLYAINSVGILLSSACYRPRDFATGRGLKLVAFSLYVAVAVCLIFVAAVNVRSEPVRLGFLESWANMERALLLMGIVCLGWILGGDEPAKKADAR